MAATKPTTKKPVLLVFDRTFAVDLVGAEVRRAVYAVNRGAHTSAFQMGRSFHVDC
jgi:hypothetical protein